MIDRPVGRNALACQPAIGGQELTERGVGEGHVIQSGMSVRAGAQLGPADQADPMVLVVIREEAHRLVLEGRVGLQHGEVPRAGPLQVADTQHDVRELPGSNSLARRVREFSRLGHDSSPFPCR